MVKRFPLIQGLAGILRTPPRSGLPQEALAPAIYLLFGGRLLSAVGSGLVLFYTSIYFVNQVGLSATQAGWGIALGSLSGVGGRIIGGTWADSPHWGRRRTLVAALIVSALGSFLLAMAGSFSAFAIANLLVGWGIGMYWPATEAAIADLAPPDRRSEAYGLTRMGDSLGLGLGVVLGVALVGLTANYRLLFLLDGLSFLAFGCLLWIGFAETRPSRPAHFPAL